MANLVSISEVKTQLGITGTSEDDKLCQIIEQVTAVIEGYTRRSFTSTTRTEYYMGNGTRELVLRHRPVTSITTIHEDEDGYWGAPDSVFGSSSLLTDGTDYALKIDNGSSTSDSGIVYRLNGVWPATSVGGHGLLAAGRENSLGPIKVVYVGGVSEVPADVKLAAIDLLASIRKRKDKGGPVTSLSLDYYSYSIGGDREDQARLDGVKHILNRYREVVF